MPGALNLHPKVAATLLGGWLTTLILYSLDHFAHIDPPATVGAALVGLIGFGCGWLAPNYVDVTNTTPPDPVPLPDPAPAPAPAPAPMTTARRTR